MMKIHWKFNAFDNIKQGVGCPAKTPNEIQNTALVWSRLRGFEVKMGGNDEEC